MASSTSLTPDGPVALWGYSQGGGATAAAVELAPQYAPAIDIIGAYVGAPPANIPDLLPYIDGSILLGAVGYMLNPPPPTAASSEAAPITGSTKHVLINHLHSTHRTDDQRGSDAK